MFPKTAYSFNIFEKRYRDMFSNIIKSDKIFCMSLLKEHKKEDYNLSPDFYCVGTLCYVIEHKKLDNGNYKIIATGMKKVLINEANSNYNYRIVKTKFLDESDFILEEELKRKKLINKFLSLISSSESINLNMIDFSIISTEMLTNLAALLLPINEFDKQKLLELSDISVRLDVLCQFMDSEIKIESDMINFNQIIPLDSNWN